MSDNDNKNATPPLLPKQLFLNPSRQHLASRIIEYELLLKRLKVRVASSDTTGGKQQEQTQILANCEAYLKEAKTYSGSIRRVILTWQLLHRLSEDTILLLSPCELAAESERLVHDIKASAIPEPARTEWTKAVEEKLKRLRQMCLEEGNAASPGNDTSHKAELACIAESLRMIANLVNDHLDDAFWDIWFKRLLAFGYSITLALALGAVAYECYPIWAESPVALLRSLVGIGLLGAVGGAASGVIGGDQEFAPKGHFWLPLSYYLTARPLFGALAAIIMLWMIQGGLFVTITPAITTCPAPCTTVQNQGQHVPSALPETAPTEKPGDSSNNSGNGSNSSLITLHSTPGSSLYLYLLILVLAGFSGDKLIRVVSDRTFAKLFAQAEKTKDNGVVKQ